MACIPHDWQYVCCKPTVHASILNGYIAVSKLECFLESNCQFSGYHRFHDRMRSLLDPLREAGKNGVDVVGVDGFVCHAYPILSAYVTDYPEQCLVTNNKRQCPRCIAEYKKIGEPVQSMWRASDAILQAMADATQGVSSEEFDDLSLQPVSPFWKGLPHCNIVMCFTPDLLHQLQKGIFKDHIVSLATHCVGESKQRLTSNFTQ